MGGDPDKAEPPGDHHRVVVVGEEVAQVAAGVPVQLTRPEQVAGHGADIRLGVVSSPSLALADQTAQKNWQG